MRAHGFLHVEISEDLSNIRKVLPKAGDIAYLGAEQILNGETWRFLEHSLLHDGSYVGWKIGELYREGTYGKIYKAHRMVVKRRKDTLFDVIETPEEVIVKSTEPIDGATVLPLEDVTAHTSEALLHVLAWRTMMNTATPWAIPRPYEVFGDKGSDGWKSMSFCMSYVNGRILHTFIQKYWKPTTKAENSQSFLEILGQIAYILHHLQHTLRLNHRDVKINNIMIRRAPQPITLTLESVAMTTEYEITVIDFGFACVGNQELTTAFQAGSWFPMTDLCCKAGRDIAQLIYCIHCYFPMDEYLTPSLAAAVRQWMTIPWSGGVADALNGFTQKGTPLARNAPEYHTGIYEFLRKPGVDPILCDPLRVFQACVDLNAGLQ